MLGILQLLAEREAGPCTTCPFYALPTTNTTATATALSPPVSLSMASSTVSSGASNSRPTSGLASRAGRGRDSRAWSTPRDFRFSAAALMDLTWTCPLSLVTKTAARCHGTATTTYCAPPTRAAKTSSPASNTSSRSRPAQSWSGSAIQEHHLASPTNGWAQCAPAISYVRANFR